MRAVGEDYCWTFTSYELDAIDIMTRELGGSQSPLASAGRRRWILMHQRRPRNVWVLIMRLPRSPCTSDTSGDRRRHAYRKTTFVQSSNLDN